MRARHSLPPIWLISDARNDTALRHVPRGAGVIFRHYHLEAPARRSCFAALRGACRILSGSMPQARCWGADGAYGPARMLARGPAGLRLVTAHSLREIGRANRIRADAVVLSPVFPTRSHPGGRTLGPVVFRLLAARSQVPVIALGGMNARRALRIGADRWAGIDAFIRRNREDS